MSKMKVITMNGSELKTDHKYEEYYINFKSLLKQSSILIITNILLMISSIILMPVVSTAYNVQELGIWAQLYAIMALIASITPLGLNYAMTRFLAVKLDKDEIGEGFNSILLFVLFILIIISIILLAFTKNLSNLLFNGNVLITTTLIPLIVMATLNSILINYFRTFDRIKFYSMILILEAYIHITLVALFAFMGYGLFYAIMAILSSKLVVFVIMLYQVYSEIDFKIPQFKNLKKYLSFSLPMIPNDLSFWAIDSGDRYIINILIGIAAVGYYMPGYSLGNNILMISGPLFILLAPILSKFYDEMQIKKVESILHYTLKYFLLLAIPLSFLLSVLSKPILMIIARPEATQGYMVTPFIAISALLYGIYIILSQILLLHKETKYIAYLWIIAVFINLGLNFILIPFAGITGAAIINLITFIFLLIGIVLNANHYEFGLFKKIRSYIVKIIFTAFLLSLPLLILPGLNSAVNILLMMFFVMITYFWVLKHFDVFSFNEILFFKMIFNDLFYQIMNILSGLNLKIRVLINLLRNVHWIKKGKV